MNFFSLLFVVISIGSFLAKASNDDNSDLRGMIKILQVKIIALTAKQWRIYCQHIWLIFIFSDKMNQWRFFVIAAWDPITKHEVESQWRNNKGTKHFSSNLSPCIFFAFYFMHFPRQNLSLVLTHFIIKLKIPILLLYLLDTNCRLGSRKRAIQSKSPWPIWQNKQIGRSSPEAPEWHGNCRYIDFSVKSLLYVARRYALATVIFSSYIWWQVR